MLDFLKYSPYIPFLDEVGDYIKKHKSNNFIINKKLRDRIINIRLKKIHVIEQVLSESILEVCKKLNCVIITSFFNKFALDLISYGAKPKSHSNTFTTEKNNILSGFILGNNNKSDHLYEPLIIKSNIDEKEYCFTNDPSGYLKVHLYNKNNNVNKNFLYASKNDDGDFITSDLDLVLIATRYKYKNEDPIFLEDKGFIMKHEIPIIDEVNTAFLKNIKLKGVNIKNDVRIIMHGPFNRYHKSNINFINLPAKVYGLNSYSKKPISLSSYSHIFEIFGLLSESSYQINVPNRWKI